MLSACDCTVDIGLHVSNAQICPVSIDCPLAETCSADAGVMTKARLPFHIATRPRPMLPKILAVAVSTDIQLASPFLYCLNTAVLDF